MYKQYRGWKRGVVKGSIPLISIQTAPEAAANEEKNNEVIRKKQKIPYNKMKRCFDMQRNKIKFTLPSVTFPFIYSKRLCASQKILILDKNTVLKSLKISPD